MADHDLAGDFAACVMAPTGLGVVEGIHAVDDRSDRMLFHDPAQIFEVTTATGRDRLERCLTQEHGHEVDAAFHARQSTHEGYLTAIGDGLDRLRQSTGAADPANPLPPAPAREGTRLFTPIRCSATVDHFVSTQRTETG